MSLRKYTLVRALTFLILLITGCSQLKLPDMGSSSPLIDLKSLLGVQATDIRMIDNDFNTSGVMTHHIAQGIELGDSILYNSEDAAKSTWAVVALPETRIVRRIQVYSKNLVQATVILSDGKTESSRTLRFKTTSSGSLKMAETSTGLTKARIIKIRAPIARSKRGSIRQDINYQVNEVYISGY